MLATAALLQTKDMALKLPHCVMLATAALLQRDIANELSALITPWHHLLPCLYAWGGGGGGGGAGGLAWTLMTFCNAHAVNYSKHAQTHMNVQSSDLEILFYV